MGRPSRALFDRCDPKDGIAPFDKLIEQFMSQEPYAPPTASSWSSTTAPRTAASDRSSDCRAATEPDLVHTPVHASWVNQAEIYFSVAQRKVLTPNNFADLDTLEQTLLAFGRRYEQIARPFEWKFTRNDLNQLLDRLDQRQPQLQLVA